MKSNSDDVYKATKAAKELQLKAKVAEIVRVAINHEYAKSVLDLFEDVESQKQCMRSLAAANCFTLNNDRERANASADVTEELREYIKRPGYEELLYSLEGKISQHYLTAIVISEGHVKYGYALRTDEQAMHGVGLMVSMLGWLVPPSLDPGVGIAKGGIDFYLKIRESQELKRAFRRYKSSAGTVGTNLALAQKVARRYALELIRQIGKRDRSLTKYRIATVADRVFETSIVLLPDSFTLLEDAIRQRAKDFAVRVSSLETWESIVQDEPNEAALVGFFRTILGVGEHVIDAGEQAKKLAEFVIKLSK